MHCLNAEEQQQRRDCRLLVCVATLLGAASRRLLLPTGNIGCAGFDHLSAFNEIETQACRPDFGCCLGLNACGRLA